MVEVRGKLFMIDCGEGAQMQLRRSHIRFTKIGHVFISHLHGDHCFGLMGMISTFGMLGRTAKLHIYATAELEPMLQSQLEMYCPHLSFEVVFHPIDTTKEEVIYEDRSLSVTTLPMQHRIPCCGFIFREKPTRAHLRNESAAPLRSYAYCSDTRYMSDLHQRIEGVSTLYHESTYADDNLLMAEKYNHSTAREAAQVARDAHAGQLLLGHYSSRYEDEDLLLNEAKAVFENTFLSQENAVFDV